MKFKLAQNRSVETRPKIVAELRKRERPNYTSAADAVQWTIDQEVRR
jgi:predicted FMN-binding regulatory protein PaiB